MDVLLQHMCLKTIKLCVVIAAVSHCGFGSAFDSHECSGAIGISNDNSSASVSLIADDSAWKKLKRKERSCTYVFNFHLVDTVKISVPNLSTSTVCDVSYSKINILASLKGKPLKSVDCKDSGNWTLAWPLDKVTIEIILSNSDGPIPQFYKSSVVIMNISTFRTNRNIHEHTLIQKIVLPTRTMEIPQNLLGCAGDFYHVLYKYEPLSTMQYYKREVRFTLSHLPVCIKVRFHSMYWNYDDKCKWEVVLMIGNELLMVLNCKKILRYWCLPESWTQMNDVLKIKFMSDDGMFSLRSYDIFVTSNDTTNQCSTTTKESLSTYSSQISLSTTTPSVTIKKNRYYTTVDTLYIEAVSGPIVGVFMFMCVLGVAFLYLRRRNNRRRNRLIERQSTRPSDFFRNENRGNSAYRQHNMETDRHGEHLLYSQDRTGFEQRDIDPPPDYAMLMASTDRSTSEMSLNYSGLITNSSSVHDPPPPCYEEALNMIGGQNVCHISGESQNINHDTDNISIHNSDCVSYTPSNHGNS